jgi:hypothetical protein
MPRRTGQRFGNPIRRDAKAGRTPGRKPSDYNPPPSTTNPKKPPHKITPDSSPTTATGNYIKAEFACEFKIKGDKITEFNQYTDTFLIGQAMELIKE